MVVGRLAAIEQLEHDQPGVRLGRAVDQFLV
jgi:hypothetical protein